MRRTANEVSPDDAIGRLYLVWGAMLGSLVIYVLVAELAGEEIRRSVGREIPLGILHNAFTGLGMVFVVVTPFLRKNLLQMPAKASAQVVVGRYTTASIVTWAIFESLTVFGLVLYFLGDEAMSLYVGFGASFAGMAWYRPSREVLEEMTARSGWGG